MGQYPKMGLTVPEVCNLANVKKAFLCYRTVILYLMFAF